MLRFKRTTSKACASPGLPGIPVSFTANRRSEAHPQQDHSPWRSPPQISGGVHGQTVYFIPKPSGARQPIGRPLPPAQVIRGTILVICQNPRNGGSKLEATIVLDLLPDWS